MAKMATSAKPKRRLSGRTPARATERFDMLLNSTEALLRDFDPDDVGLYQIAEHAGVPPASVYHFFPTKDAAFLALVRRYLDGFSAVLREPIPAAELGGWQDLMRVEQRRAMALYNEHPAAMKLLYGGYGSSEIREANLGYSRLAAQAAYRRLDVIFHMPFLRDPTHIFEITIALLDAVWALSYAREGRIAERYHADAFEACVAFCRIHLPERVEMRQVYREAVERGEDITVPDTEVPGEPLGPIA